MNKGLERNYALKTIWIGDNYFNAPAPMGVYITKLRKHLKEDPLSKSSNITAKGFYGSSPGERAVTQRRKRLLVYRLRTTGCHGPFVCP